MKFDLKIYLMAGCILTLIAAAIIATLWSNTKIASLERDVGNAKSLAAQKQNAADELEKRTAEFNAKNEYLEQQIDELRAVAQKQDEALTKLSKNTVDARSNVERTRRTRTVAATADQLCAKLADLGHPCE
jgi:chromosome segregation ATPase